MKSDRRLSSIALGCLLAASRVGAIDSPFDVGGKTQLFVDQVIVRSAEHVAFTLHPATKHPKNPLVKADRPQDGWRLALCGSVLYDVKEKLFKMWYLGGNGTLYATSDDGIRWQKHDASWNGHMFVSVIKDGTDLNPARRYKIIAWSPNAPGVATPGYDPPIYTGYNVSVSPDGKEVTRLSEQPICPGGDVITGYYDRQRRLYVAFPKTMTSLRGFNQRCFSVITSKDFATWTKPVLAFVPDLRDNAGSLARIEEVRPILDVPDDPRRMRTEFYAIAVYPHESCTIAFPWLLTINNNGRSSSEGPGEVQLAVSRDLEHWERPFRLPVIPRGKIGEWDCGWFWTANEAIRVGDEIWLYYAGGNFTHDSPCLSRAEGTGRGDRYTSSIGLATWKLDRFVSADGPTEGGTLTTVPIVFSGERLELNATTASGGEVTVELLDVTGKLLAKSKPFAGDDLRHRVEWIDALRIGELAGQPVSLKFEIKNAQLFSFAFRK